MRKNRNETFCKEYNKNHGGGLLIIVSRTFEVVTRDEYQSEFMED